MLKFLKSLFSKRCKHNWVAFGVQYRTAGSSHHFRCSKCKKYKTTP